MESEICFFFAEEKKNGEGKGGKYLESGIGFFAKEMENIWKRKAKIAKFNTTSPIMIFLGGRGFFLPILLNSECTITGFV